MVHIETERKANETKRGNACKHIGVQIDHRGDMQARMGANRREL